MKSPPELKQSGFASFRVKLTVAMMGVVVVVVGSGLVFAQRNVSAGVRLEFQNQFRNELASLHAVETVRHAALVERCRALVRKPRIHAALEDNALDLLYPSAHDELSDVLEGAEETVREPSSRVLRARFYRFLDGSGEVIYPSDAKDIGPLRRDDEPALALSRLPEKPQIGYMVRRDGGTEEIIDEIIATPILSGETGEPIAALVLGFKPFAFSGAEAGTGFESGLWIGSQLHMASLPVAAVAELEREVSQVLGGSEHSDESITVRVGGVPFLLFYRQLNADSLFPPAYEVCIYSLKGLLARQRQLLWEFAGVGGLLLIAAFTFSHLLSARLSAPVEKLAVNSQVNLTRRKRAEAALDLSHEELQRSARFSADASHQLKTPVTVLRLGLEDLLAGENLSPEARDEISTLVHQTFRLTSVIDDLLLLSRMDAGRLKLAFAPVNLTRLVEGWLDDLGAIPDELNLTIEAALPPNVMIAGEQRYTTLILQNLLENARKYNRPHGRIHVSLRIEGSWLLLTIGNTGRTIVPEAQPHIFERFHRATVGENVPGHGLGLNLARELARLHRGEIQLTTSDNDWTEFEVRFLVAEAWVEEVKSGP